MISRTQCHDPPTCNRLSQRNQVERRPSPPLTVPSGGAMGVAQPGSSGNERLRDLLSASESSEGGGYGGIRFEALQASQAAVLVDVRRGRGGVALEMGCDPRADSLDDGRGAGGALG